MAWGDGFALVQLLRENGFDCSKVREGVLARVEGSCVKLDGMERVKQSSAPAVSPRRQNGWLSDRYVPEIVEDMSRGDIVETLQHLRLPYEALSVVLRLDKGCRDFIVAALRSR
jgi:hypothetical protein